MHLTVQHVHCLSVCVCVLLALYQPLRGEGRRGGYPDTRFRTVKIKYI